MCDATCLSQRRACRLAGLSLSTCRYEAPRPDVYPDASLNGHLNADVLATGVYGSFCGAQGFTLITKRVYRLYNLQGLGVKRRRRRKVLATEYLPLLRPATPNLAWSMDFVMDTLSSGRRIKCLTISVAFGISGLQVIHMLDSIALFRGYPATIRTDQGPEFTCWALD